MIAMSYTKVPNACKAFMAYMLEAEQFNPWSRQPPATSRTR